MRRKQVFLVGLLLFFIFNEAQYSLANDLPVPSQSLANPSVSQKENPSKKQLPFPLKYFDGVRFQITNAYPKLTHVNHQIDTISKLLGTDYSTWDEANIFTVDFALWKNLNRYFKMDVLIAVSSGAITDREDSYLDIKTKFVQKYDVGILTSNLYYYPLSYGARLIDPFVGSGISYTFLKEKTTVRLENKYFYNKVRSAFGDQGFGGRIMGGIDVNLGCIWPSIKNWGITLLTLYSWNRMQGDANVHLTDNTRILGKRINRDLQANSDFKFGEKEHMDIDLSGVCYSLAVSYKF